MSTRSLTLGRNATQNDPHRNLACAVLWQAIQDARAERTAAQLWLRAGAGGLFDALGIDPAAVLRATERRNRQQES